VVVGPPPSRSSWAKSSPEVGLSGASLHVKLYATFTFKSEGRFTVVPRSYENAFPPRNPLGPQALAYGRVLGVGVFL